MLSAGLPWREPSLNCEHPQNPEPVSPKLLQHLPVEVSLTVQIWSPDTDICQAVIRDPERLSIRLPLIYHDRQHKIPGSCL
jgi:hypothetical protein